MFKTVASLTFLLAVTLGVAQRVQPIAPAKGAFSVAFSADWFRSQDGVTASTLFATPAVFLTDHLELRLPFGVAHVIGTDQLIYGVGARWHFAKKGQLLDPFAGFVVEHSTARRFREDLVALQFGAHYFVANNIAVTTLLSLGRDRTNGFSQDTTHFVTGFTVLFAEK